MPALVRNFQFSDTVPSEPKKTRPPYHWWQWYLWYFPYLGIGIVGGGFVWFVFQSVEPSSIQNILWPNSYLPLIGGVFITLWCVGGYFFRHPRRGLWLALVGVLLLYWRLGVTGAEIGFFAIAPLTLLAEGLLTWRQRR